MSEYEKLMEALSKRWCNFDGVIPQIYGDDFICIINDKEFLFENNETYTYDEIIEYINKKDEEEIEEMENLERQMLMMY